MLDGRDFLIAAGLFKSIDSGETWVAAQNPPSDINALAIDPSASGRMYANHVSGVSISTDEIAKLDNEGPTGWVRTGFQFNAYAAPNGNSAPVCRFFSVAFAPKSSHFYTPFAAECSLRQTDPAWMLESADAFDIGAAAADGSCAANLTPVYRLYNNGQGGAPNHRYTTNAGVRANMIGQGWVPEGLGPNGVEMCSPL